MSEINYEYEKMHPFKWFILQNFPFLEDSIDTLTNYQLFCKLGEEINKNRDSINEIGENESEVVNAFNSLYDYVHGYFENLDVQDEIDNKLDELVEDGTITNLIKEYIDPIQDSFETEIRNQIDFINNKVQNIESTTPIPVESVTQMTDISKIYLNITNGKWYYYDGTEWQEGGLYQGIELGNDSVGFTNLNQTLKDNFTTSFNTFGSLGSAVSGLIKNNNGNVQVVSSANYEHFIIDLDIGATYNFTGYNYLVMCGLVIADSNGVILYDSNTNQPSTQTFFSYTTKISQNGLKAYLCHETTATNDVRFTSNPSYRILSKVSNQLLIDNTPVLLHEEQAYTVYNTGTHKIAYQQNANANTKVYAMEKGKHYKFNVLSYMNIKGLLIFDESYNLEYIVNDSQTPIMIDYEFTATKNGFIFLVKYQNYDAKMEVVNETLEELKQDIIEETSETISQQLGFSKWYAIGDSITATTYRASKNYLNYIKEDIPLLTIQNLGVAGTGYMAGDNTFIDRIVNINSYDLNNDIITVMGSINDIQYVPTVLGNLGDTTTDTIYGCLYTFFYTLFNSFNGVRIGCISPIIAKSYFNNTETWNKYLKALEDTCKLFNVPYLNILNSCNLRPEDDSFLNEYYEADGEGNNGQIDSYGVHPNSKGYRLFYNKIKEFIKTL